MLAVTEILRLPLGVGGRGNRFDLPRHCGSDEEDPRAPAGMENGDGRSRAVIAIYHP
jgi:hypothetical protein